MAQISLPKWIRTQSSTTWYFTYYMYTCRTSVFAVDQAWLKLIMTIVHLLNIKNSKVINRRMPLLLFYLFNKICSTSLLLFFVAIWSAFSPPFSTFFVISSSPLDNSRNGWIMSASPWQHASWKALIMVLQYRDTHTPSIVAHYSYLNVTIFSGYLI